MKILHDEWEKLAAFLGVDKEDIYQEDVNTIFNQNHATGENSGLYCSYYNIPNSIIENLKDYVDILKAENIRLKEELDKKNNSTNH